MSILLNISVLKDIEKFGMSGIGNLIKWQIRSSVWSENIRIFKSCHWDV